MDRRSRALAAAAQADAVCGPPPARRRAHDVSSRSPRLGRWTSRPRGRRATGMSAAFQDLVDLAGERFGAVVVAANDDFFAPKDNLIKHGAPVWIEAKYTDRGKWMDGWETRRLREPRAEPYDWCVIRLGAAGLVRGVDVETTHFKGNYPESCAVDVASGFSPTTAEMKSRTTEWREILKQTPLKGDAHNLFAIDDAPAACSLEGSADERTWTELLRRTPLTAHATHTVEPSGGVGSITHVRFNIYPDGGVGRLRLYGTPT